MIGLDSLLTPTLLTIYNNRDSGNTAMKCSDVALDWMLSLLVVDPHTRPFFFGGGSTTTRPFPKDIITPENYPLPYLYCKFRTREGSDSVGLLKIPRWAEHRMNRGCITPLLPEITVPTKRDYGGVGTFFFSHNVKTNIPGLLFQILDKAFPHKHR